MVNITYFPTISANFGNCLRLPLQADVFIYTLLTEPSKKVDEKKSGQDDRIGTTLR